MHAAALLLIANTGLANASSLDQMPFGLVIEQELQSPSTVSHVLPAYQWTRYQQTTFQGVSNSGSQNYQRRSLIIYQQAPEWHANWRGGLRWKASSHLELTAKGNRMKSKLKMPFLQLCSYCSTHMDTTVWRDGHVQMKITAFFE